jgi:hypothetical protein
MNEFGATAAQRGATRLSLLEIARVLVRLDHDCQPHHRDGKRFVVRADEKLTAFLELQLAIGVYEPIHVDIADLGPKVPALT